MFSEVIFGAYLAYFPQGKSTISSQSRKIRNSIKGGVEDVLRQVTEHLIKSEAEKGTFASILGSDVVLVPAPGSAPFVMGALWPAFLIAEKLVDAGFGRKVTPGLERINPVPKSALQPRGTRPKAKKHYVTIAIKPQSLLNGERITIVDDFITKGNTLRGAASRIAEVYPHANVQAFALIRTMGLQPEIENIIDPCVGKISLGYQGDSKREP